jgi:hypothetical protein
MKKMISIAIFLAACGSAAFARPIYAMKESKPCLYCHVDPKGGGTRNPRGVYYAQHSHTFRDFDEDKVMGQYKARLMHKAWSETLPAAARRVAVADTLGDGVLRLVILSEGDSKDSRSLSVRKWDSGAWKTEFSAELPGSGDRLAVGKFSSGKPAVIVTDKALFYWDGKTYAKKASVGQLAILGTVVLKTGGDKLLLMEAGKLKVHSVDVDAEKWLQAGADPPPIAYMSFTDMKGPTDDLTAVGMPKELATGGVVGVWDTQKANLLLLYGIQVDEVRETKPDAKTALDNELKGYRSHITIVDPRVPVFKPLWHSETLPGSVLDVTLNDPRTGAKGILVLSDGSEDGKGHTLCFYQLD